MKLAILHDYFDKRGGGERLVTEVAKAFNADIYTGFIDYNNTFEELKSMNVFSLGKKINNPALRAVYLMNKFKKLKLKKYDLYFFSGTLCISAAKNLKPSILYCHTPPRYIYDLKNYFNKTIPFYKLIFLYVLRAYMKPKDQKYMRSFDKIVTNSENVRTRLKRYYSTKLYRDSEVVYSLIDLKKFKYKSDGEFYLSFGRLDKLKRVDLIVKSFQKMPDKNLIVVSDGPEKETILNLCNHHKNIKFLGKVSNKKLIELIGSSIATIYLPIDEDMGLTPIESNACGKPCIGADEGGLKEMIVDGKTGFLIKPNMRDVIKTVKKLDKKKAASMRKDCEKFASKFSIEQFIRIMKKQFENVLK